MPYMPARVVPGALSAMRARRGRPTSGSMRVRVADHCTMQDLDEVPAPDAPGRRGPRAARIPPASDRALQKRPATPILEDQAKPLTEVSVKHSTILIAACVTAGVLTVGMTKSALAAPERQAAQPAAAVEHRFAQLQDRGRDDHHFQEDPEFPPDDYLGDIEVPGEGRPDVSGPGSRSPEPPSLEHRDAPALAPPGFGEGTDIPRHQRGEFPPPPEQRPRFRDAPGGDLEPWR